MPKVLGRIVEEGARREAEKMQNGSSKDSKSVSSGQAGIQEENAC